MEPTPPPEGWTLREAADALCPDAARLHAEGGEPLAAALSAEMGKWAVLLDPTPDLWLADRLRAALAGRPDLRLTGRDLAKGIAAPRFTVPADVLRLAAITTGRKQVYLDLDLAGDAARISCSFEAARPDLPGEVKLMAVRVERVERVERAASRALSKAPPPPGGWTLAEAAAALLPDLYAPASQPPPANWWMAGGPEAHKRERDALRLAFARLMEAGEYAADGIALSETEPSRIPPHLWRMATFALGLRGEPQYPAEVMAGGRCWRGVRVTWVSTTPATDNVPKAARPAAEPAPAVPAGDWMQKNVTRAGQWKRDAALAECRSATGCSHREALAAWTALPPEVKGTRGRPRKAAD